jgi:hypothetical protein
VNPNASLQGHASNRPEACVGVLPKDFEYQTMANSPAGGHTHETTRICGLFLHFTNQNQFFGDHLP